MVALGVLLLLGLGIGYAGLRAYLHSEGFRKFLSAQVSGTAKVHGAFAPFHWDGLAVETAAFDATGEGLIAGIKADEITTEIGFGGIRRGVWEIKDTRITRLEIALNPQKATAPSPVAPERHKKSVAKKQPSWVPDEVELSALTIGELAFSGELSEGPVQGAGMRIHVLPTTGKKSYKGEISGGYLDLPQEWVPRLNIHRIRGSFRDGSAFINKAEISAWHAGRINAWGEWNDREKTYSFEGDVDGIKCDELLNENWARRLTGDVSSTFTVGNSTGEMVGSGDLVIRNGTMTALPMLDALAAYADTRRFRVLQLSDARTKWRHTAGETLLTDFVMGSEGLIRLEGNLSIKGKNLDGRFRLGLVPGTLKNIPGAETHVFQPGERGLLWTNLRITGTIDDPKEDLTDRLIEAAGIRMFEQIPETGEKVLKFTRSVLGESPVKAIDKAEKVIKEGEKAIKSAEGILKGLLR